MIKTPPYLQKGDTIGIVCPAGAMPVEKISECIRVLNEDWGFTTKVGKTVGNQFNYFSGTDEERLADFQQMLDDDEVKAVLCARGGYGFGRIIDKIDFEKFEKKPKWIIGYSDITVLHSHLYSNYYISSLHSPMAGAFNEDGYKNEFVQSVKNALQGKKLKYQCPVHEFNRKGEAIGELVGGNLALLAHLTGTDSDIKTKGRILFIEDVGEYLYNIDRMLYQLKRSGKLSKLAGLIIGGFTDMKDTETPFGQTAYEIVRDIVKEYDYPVCYDFPVSHSDRNYALKVGVGYKLKVTKSKVSLEE
jgi:muramoyltetrapeptide carboxypeptidase